MHSQPSLLGILYRHSGALLSHYQDTCKYTDVDVVSSVVRHLLDC